MAAVEVLLNTKLVSELIEKGDFSGVRDYMDKSMAEGSQSFEEDLARLIQSGKISRAEGLANADSPTNLTWRMQNASQAVRPAAATAVPTTPAPIPQISDSMFSNFLIDADSGADSAPTAS